MWCASACPSPHSSPRICGSPTRGVSQVPCRKTAAGMVGALGKVGGLIPQVTHLVSTSHHASDDTRKQGGKGKFSQRAHTHHSSEAKGGGVAHREEGTPASVTPFDSVSISHKTSADITAKKKQTKKRVLNSRGGGCLEVCYHKCLRSD